MWKEGSEEELVSFAGEMQAVDKQRAEEEAVACGVAGEFEGGYTEIAC